MKVRSGSIPKELTFILAKPQMIKITWDDVDMEDDDVVKEEEVFPVFVSDSTNEGTLKTGRAWAKNSYNYHYGNSKPATPVTKEKTTKNEPFTRPRIFGLDHRYNGGRAWKCADAEGHYFDLREDVLLDIMRTVGVSEGGYLNGEYIWAKVGAEMKIVRVDSDLHKALVQATARKEMKMISKKELQPMHVYSQKNGDAYLYLGHAASISATRSEIQDQATERRYQEWCQFEKDRKGWQAENYFRTYKSWHEPSRPAIMKFDCKTENEHVWIKLDTSWNDSKPKEENIKFLESKKGKFIKHLMEAGYNYGNMYKFQGIVTFSNNIKVVDDLGVVEIPDIWEQIRSQAVKILVEKEKKEEMGPVINRIFTERNRLIKAASLCPYGTLHPKGTEIDDAYDFWVTALLSAEPT